MTEAEIRLWSDLKRLDHPGTHFRRQVPIGPYVADFACHRAKLVIEVDGQSHTYDGAIARDATRTRFIEGEGYRVVRFTNEDVYHNASGVIDCVLAELAQLPEHRVERSAKRDGGGRAMPPNAR